MKQNEEKKNQLAREILLLSRNTLLVNLRFLDVALSRFTLVPIEEPSLMTDGKYILYQPKYVLEKYRSEREIPVRNYLHIVLHCIFHHMYMDATLEHSYWDLACDIAVENIISELGLPSTAAKREQEQKKYLEIVRKELKVVTAEKLYHYLREGTPNPVKVAQLRGLFYADDHEIWYLTEAETKVRFGLLGSNDEARAGNSGQDGEGSDSRSRQAEIWADISKQVQVDMETFHKQRGDQAGGLIQNLNAVNREKYDYAAFLKKFAVMGEAMRVNDDEFDYIFYTYGLQLYKNTPLIEPLEYKEQKRIKEFVIAIDTSGSTAGELVQRFVQKTYNILKSTESFFSKINLHIIQCDAEIQEDKKITCQEEFDEYLKTMQIHGLGGTDFRPVFSYVDTLVQDGEFTNLKGLIYFTDGYGAFPAKMPDYDTAFVFVEDEYNNPDVPPWAIKLVLQKDEI
jgi:predicted metal-dependent peptidase